MEKGNKNQLMDQLAQYGYELSVPAAPVSAPDKVLEALLEQDDARLLEGFPVVLANVLSQPNALEWEKTAWRPGKKFSSKVRARLTLMLGLSALLFELFGMAGHRERVSKLLLKLMGEKETKQLMDLLTGPFSRSEGLDLETDESHLKALGLDADRTGTSSSRRSRARPLRLDADRLKNSFRNYVVHQTEDGEKLEEQKSALEYELLLSRLFTVRQKELLRQRLAGKPMTKTEREYYYRVVKKRLNALADPRLHQMARSLV